MVEGTRDPDPSLHKPGTLDRGARLGPYEIRASIGAGGMGEVYRAFDTRLGREVALKVLPHHSLGSPEAMRRFQREARAVAALNHPNILAIHDVGSEGDVHFAVTELLEGDTLRARLASGPLTPSKAIEYGAQIAHGLAAAHERDIVHRDLKPENVFITHTGRVKILDFGIALHDAPAVADNEPTVARLTQTGLIVGTVGYVSPEQVLGNPATRRSDLFALGVVMYEMLTGTHPFRRATTPETQTAILREDHPSIARAVPGLPPLVGRLIDLCLQKQPTERPESARDLALFLEASGAATSTWSAAAPSLPGETPAALPVLSGSLGRRLLVVVCGVVVALTAATWGFVRVAGGRAVETIVEADVLQAEGAVRRLHREHLDRLGLTARLVASFPELKALLATDVATVEDFLQAFQQRFPRTPLLVALGPEGALLGGTSTPGLRADGGSNPWLAAISPGDREGTVLDVAGRPYLAVGAASEAAGTIFGYIVAAEAIDQTLAGALREATQDEMLLLSDRTLVASTLRAGQAPFDSLKAWHMSGGRTDRLTNVEIGAQHYAAREVSLSTDPMVSVVILKSRDGAGAAYAGIERGVLLIGMTAIAIVILGGAWWARREAPGIRDQGSGTKD